MTGHQDDIEIAVLHDRIPQIGGGEQVAFDIARTFNAPLYTAYRNPAVETPEDISVTPLFQSKYQSGVSQFALKWKAGGGNPLEPISVLLDMSRADQLSEYDVIISSGPLSKSYVPDQSQKILNYPHSPPRWLYDQYRERLNELPQLPGVNLGVTGLSAILRTIDQSSNPYIDQFIANSEIVQERIERYYNRNSTVIYPPVSDDWYHDADNGYFLTWSRLVPNKRTDLIVRAFQTLDEELHVVGEGPERERLDELANGHRNIHIKGYVEDIQSEVANSRAVVYAPKDEDFGMVGAEALRAGKPLIGVDEGFTKHQAIPGKTGLRFEPTVESLRDAVRSFDPDKFDVDDIQSAGEKYSYEEFESQLIQAVSSVVNS